MTERLSSRIRAERVQRGWSLTELATRSGVSRAMVHRIERGDSSPTAQVLSRIAVAFGMSMSELFSKPVSGAARLLRASDRVSWRDPDTGYLRETLSPAGTGPALDIVRVTLPPGKRVAFPAESYGFAAQSLWVLEGTLVFEEGETRWQLGPDDCLSLGAPQDCAFVNEASEPCRYAVIIARL